MKKEGDLDYRRARSLWEKARPAKVERKQRGMTSILSVRLPRQVLKALPLTARRHGKGPGTLARELIEQGLLPGGSYGA